ncbi:MAG TPA: hypothetical protein PKG92_04010, partial [Anaerolineaceae bacterium]|nr:hypothetical protein [Anaerolineaceae bacterium]
LAMQVKQDPDLILGINGIGIRAMESIHELMAALDKQLADEQAALVKQAEETAEEMEVLEPVSEIELPAEVDVVPSVEVEPVLDVTVGETSSTETIEEPEPEKEPSLEELFTLRPEVLDTAGLLDDDEAEESGKAKKKGKKKGKSVVVTYDPDRDLTVVQKKHKRGGNDWDWDE